MQLTINYRQTACRLLAGLFFFLLLVPMAAGEEVSPPPTYWKDQISKVDRLANKDGGDGKKGNPILIATAKELAYFAQQVNSKLPITYGSGTDQIEPNGKDQDAGGFKDYYFALSANINLEKHYWTPIGTEDNPFKGYFDGKGHCVSGLKVNVNSGLAYVYAGLFGNAHNGTIQNLGVRLAQAGVRIEAKKGNVYAGGLAAVTNSVYNCYVEGPGTVKAIITEENSDPSRSYYVYAGGIAGKLNARAIHCYSTVDVKAEGPSVDNYAGGIAGQIDNSSLTSNTYATGTVEAVGAESNNYAGGIVGFVMGNSSSSSSSSTFEYNLALNDSVKGSYRNRMVGDNGSNVTFSSNYASPDMLVNGKTVSGGTDGDANGDPDVNLDNFGKVFSGDDGWDTSDKARLPKLRMRTGDGPDYEDWPNGNQLTLPAYDYLQADKIANTNGGNGLSWKNAIQIANRAELAYLAKQVNAGKDLAVSNNVAGGSIENKTGDDSGFKGIYFALSADIDLKEHYWTPIGTFSNPFQGNFDGAGHKVEGLVVNVDVVSNSAYAGLFGYLYDGATIRNLGIRLGEAGVKATVSTTESRTTLVAYAGGLAGKLSSGTIISNCYVEGEACVKATSPYVTYAGGLVGYTSDNVIITHCYTTVNVSTDGLQNGQCGAGGIVGSSSGEISYTYATGTVDAKGVTYAGGICGIIGTNGTITNSLALNTAINGRSTGRIVGIAKNKLTSNYATPLMQLSGQTSSDNQVDNENGANTWPGSFEADLKKEPAGDANGWATSWTFTSGYLPQLMKKTADGYEAWSSEQPQLKTNLYFPSRPKLHIVSPTGGTLKVTDKDGNELPNGSDILPGTPLTLAYTEDANYHFSGYLSGSNEGSLSSYSGNSIMMPDADLYLSATFTYQKPEPEEPPYIPPVPPYVPPVPIYYSVYLPQVEGASTDPGPGEYEVESWSTFRFYLTIDSAYSESQPVITTDRGETLEPRSSDGAYLVKYVRTDVEVFIDGIVQNPPPVANEAIGTDALVPQIWSEGTMLCIRMADALPSAPVRIFTVDGRLYDSFASTPGLNRRQLPTGVYIVRVGDTACKVIVK